MEEGSGEAEVVITTGTEARVVVGEADGIGEDDVGAKVVVLDVTCVVVAGFVVLAVV